jgi:hypothetical protein
MEQIKMAKYESDITLFIQELKKKHPELEQKQAEGRARLWDKPQDAGLQRAFDAAEISSKRAGY